jgi:hypothetical protein
LSHYISSFLWFLFFFFFWLRLEFELRALLYHHSTAWATPPVQFALIIFGDGILGTICPGLPRTVTLPISTSQVARITGVSHQCPAAHFFYW